MLHIYQWLRCREKMDIGYTLIQHTRLHDSTRRATRRISALARLTKPLPISIIMHMIPSNPEPTDQQLIEQWRGQPAPFLSLLHAFHDRDGYLSETAMRAIARGLRQPIADLFATTTFYHHF